MRDGLAKKLLAGDFMALKLTGHDADYFSLFPEIAGRLEEVRRIASDADARA